MLSAWLIEALGSQVADLLETTGETAFAVTFGEMADGSRRHYALIDTTVDSAGHEQQYRVSSPADETDSPAWAVKRYGTTRWLAEVKVADHWVELADPADEWLNEVA